MEPFVRGATGIWTQFGTVEEKRISWGTFTNFDAKPKHRDARY